MWLWDLVPLALGLLCAIGIICGLHPKFYRRGSETWINDIGAPIDPDIREIVQQGRGRRLACLCAGGLAGLCLGFTLNFAVFAEHPYLRSMLIIGAFVMGLCAGLIVRAFTAAFRADGGTVRVAHATASQVGDFIRPKAQVLIRIEVLAATIVCVIIAIQPAWDGPGFAITGSGPLWAAAVLIPFGYLLTEVLVGRLLQRPTPGATPRSLVWHDALRREMVVDLAMTPSAVVLLAALIVYSWTSNPWADLPLPPFFSLIPFAFYLAACNMPGLFQRLNDPEHAAVGTA